MRSLTSTKDESVRTVFATRCRDDRWAADVRSCVVSTMSLKDPKHCKAKLPADARARLDADLATTKTKAIPEACRDYARTVEKLMSCDKIPQAARDAIKQSYDSQRALWTKDEGDSAAGSCRPAADAMKQAAASVGCPLL